MRIDPLGARAGLRDRFAFVKLALAAALAFFAAILAAMFFGSPAVAIPPPPVPPAPAGAATYSKEQLEAETPQELLQQLLSDWASGVVEKRTDEGGLTFYTKPKVGFVGVCSVTRVRVETLTPTSGTNGRSYVNGLVIEELYHYVDLPGPFDPIHGASFNATTPLCEALPAGTKYIAAPSALVAAYQRHLIEDAVAQSKGREGLNFKLDCIRSAGPDCDARKVLSTLHPSEIHDITKRDCPGYSRDECYEVAVGDWYVEIESRLSTYEYTLWEPDRILVGIGLSKLPHYLVVNCNDCR